jgi:N-acetylgalactosamine kinase
VNITAGFKKLFPEAQRPSLYRAPGRVNLIGEHTDYNGLPVLPMAIDHDISICASPRSDNRAVIRNTNPSFEEREFEIDFRIPPYPKGDWGNYCKSAFQALQDYLIDRKKENRLLRGVNLLIDGNIPAGSGLSSSSALVVATALVINDLNNLNLDKLFLAELLARGERYVGTEGGGMDQAASLSGKKGMVLKIDFFPLRIEYVSFPGNYAIVVCNSLVDAGKSTSANLAYNQRVVECRLGAALIRKAVENKCSRECDITLLGDLRKPEFSHMLGNIDAMLEETLPGNELTLTEISSFLSMDENSVREQYLKLKSGVYFKPPSSGLRIKNRLRHVLTEAERVEKSRKYIEDRRIDEFGQLMYESHKSCAVDYEISCPELDALVEIARKNGAVGARLTGAGFGGCTVNMVHKEKISEFIENMTDGYYRSYLKKKGAFSNFIFACQPSDGARKIT